MEDLFVPFEIALEMKLLEFNDPCFGYYGEINGGEIELFLKKEFNSETPHILAPTFAQCFKFFREKYGIKTFVYEVLEERFVFVTHTNSLDYKMSSTYHTTYEEAELACLTELNNVVKNKKP